MPTPLGVDPSVFIFGDSLTKYLQEDCSYIGGCNVTLFCQRGGTVSSIRESILAITNDLLTGSTPDVIFVHVGTNDLEYCLVENIIANYKDLIATLCGIFPNTPILVNNILKRVDCEPLDAAGQYFNIKLGNLAATLSNVTYVDIGSTSDLAPDGLHLTRDAYYDFAEELVKCVSHKSKERTACRYRPCMIPPLVRVKSAKQIKRERREHLQQSAENCRFTRPCLFECRKRTRSPASRQRQPRQLTAEPKPLHCYQTIPYRQLCSRIPEKTYVRVSTNTKNYIRHRQAMQVKKRKMRAAKKRRHRKKGTKVRRHFINFMGNLPPVFLFFSIKSTSLLTPLLKLYSTKY